MEEEAQVIENLTKRNKDLEEHMQKFYTAELFTAKQVKLIEKDYIPKSKVKEKIEEEKSGIKSDLDNYKKLKDENWKKAIHQNIIIRNEKIKLCEELLQEGDDK